MRQRSYGRDRELTFRMSFTVLMLAMVWVAFIGLLFWAGLNPDTDTGLRAHRGTIPVLRIGQDRADDDRSQGRHP